jgi:hypothetical protein
VQIAAADAVQIELESHELCVGFEHLPNPPWIKTTGFSLAGRCGAGGAICAENSRLQWMHALLQEREIELQNMV